jgi:hypothetical protein
MTAISPAQNGRTQKKINNIVLLLLSVTTALPFLAADLAAQPVVLRKTSRMALESRLRDCPEKNAQRLEKLKELFKAAGCPEDRLSEQAVKGFREPNVIAVLPGQTESTILVGAHFDNESSGHGVLDNWSGAVLLPTLYESLKSDPRRHTFIFIGFTAEEAGLKGSNHYARNMTGEEVGRTRALINLDCLGLGTTAVFAISANKRLSDMLADMAAAVKLPLRYSSLKGGRWDADSFSGKIPKITIHSITERTRPNINSFLDNFDAVKWKEYYDSYLLVAAYLAYLDTQLE